MSRIHDAILSAASLGLLVAALTMFDKDVRRHVVTLVSGDVSEMAVVAAPISRAARAGFQLLNDYRTDDGPLFAFAVAAVVLFGLLFKS